MLRSRSSSRSASGALDCDREPVRRLRAVGRGRPEPLAAALRQRAARPAGDRRARRSVRGAAVNRWSCRPRWTDSRRPSWATRSRSSITSSTPREQWLLPSQARCCSLGKPASRPICRRSLLSCSAPGLRVPSTPRVPLFDPFRPLLPGGSATRSCPRRGHRLTPPDGNGVPAPRARAGRGGGSRDRPRVRLAPPSSTRR
jgi:hypothetical protein